MRVVEAIEFIRAMLSPLYEAGVHPMAMAEAVRTALEGTSFRLWGTGGRGDHVICPVCGLEVGDLGPDVGLALVVPDIKNSSHMVLAESTGILLFVAAIHRECSEATSAENTHEAIWKTALLEIAEGCLVDTEESIVNGPDLGPHN